MSRMPRRLRDVSNTNFGTLNRSKDKHLVCYETNQYVLASKDSILSSSQVLDGDLPDDFVTQIESEIDLDNLSFRGIDGGAF